MATFYCSLICLVLIVTHVFGAEEPLICSELRVQLKESQTVSLGFANVLFTCETYEYRNDCVFLRVEPFAEVRMFTFETLN